MFRYYNINHRKGYRLDLAQKCTKKLGKSIIFCLFLDFFCKYTLKIRCFANFLAKKCWHAHLAPTRKITHRC